MPQIRYKPTIVVDARESYEVKTALIKLGSHVVEESLSPADYVVSEDCAVERKRLHDFFRSLFDGRLFDQIQRLTEAYESPCLLVEGDVIEGVEAIHSPLVFWGALARVISDHPVSIVFTPNESHTAMFLHSLAKKFQEEEKSKISVKHKPKIYTMRQRQLLAVQSLPMIGPKRAEKLLKEFGSVRSVFQASNRELLSVRGLGERTVQRILELLDTKYPGLEQ